MMDSDENSRNGARGNNDYSDIAVFDDFDYSDDSADPNYQYHTKEHIPTDQVRVGRSILDFAREAEEAERPKLKEPEPEPQPPRNELNDADIYADMLSDIDLGVRRSAPPLQNQTMVDKMAAEMNRKSVVVSDMSDPYTLERKRRRDISEDAPRDEKLIMKERLENEVNKRPENFNVRQNAEMYYALVDEQEINQARRGFGYLVLIIIVGILTAGLTLLKLNWNGSDLFVYFSIGALSASLILFIKLKFFKVVSCLYFAAHTAFLIGPGVVKYLTDPVPKTDDFRETIIYFIAAIAMSAISCIALATNMDIDNYYTTPLRRKKRKEKNRVKGKKSGRR